uniref:NAD(+) diphosphatase n=1 Tax=Phallusia mammillata TaxID=59560 RepID=A0A6F9DNK5_9ASCI|nr:peroxisomal NADH pyrophosphatase NUDT12 [Phallusia mammillata]
MNSDNSDDRSDMHQTYVKRILEAAADGNVKTLQENKNALISVTTECRNKNGWTPLMLATRNGHIETMEFLLENGADPKAINKSGQTPLGIANFWNQSTSAQLIQKFLEPEKGMQYELVNHFSVSSVDRQSYKRTDTEHIETAKKSPTSKFLVFAEMQLVISQCQHPKRGTEVVWFSWSDVEKNLNSHEHDIIFLGVGDLASGRLLRETPTSCSSDVAYFAVNFKKELSEDDFPISHRKGAYAAAGMNQDLLRLSKEESGIVAQAKSVLAWHDKYIYCPTCGSSTNMGDAGYKRNCSNTECISHRGAHNTCFPRTDPVVIALIISKDGNKCLLCRQGRHPPRMYSCPAGFLEPGETIEDAARREVMEECGIHVGPLKYHSSQPWPFPSNLMIGLIGHAINDDITVDDVELEDAKYVNTLFLRVPLVDTNMKSICIFYSVRWFDRAEVATALIEGFKRPTGLIVPPHYAIAHQLMKAWLQMTSNL